METVVGESTNRTFTSTLMRSRTPNGMMAREAVAPWVRRTLVMFPEFAWPKGGTTTGRANLCSKEV
jgi:hypothetical protein